MTDPTGTLSPVSVGSDWDVSRYQSVNGGSGNPDNPYSPTIPPSAHRNPTMMSPPASGSSTLDGSGGGLPNGMNPRQSNGGGHPSPPSSIARSSNGTGLYPSNGSRTDSVSSRSALVMEEALAEHYHVLRDYLAPYLRDEKGNPRPNRARDKLLRLSAVQFQELSTDVYDESIRREEDRRRGGPNAPGNGTPKYLLPKDNFHPKRNQARQKLSTLPLERFRQLATDVFYELERRFPRFVNGPFDRPASPAGSTTSSNRGMSGRMGTPNSMSGGFRGPPPPGRGGPPFRNSPPPGMAGPGGLNVPGMAGGPGPGPGPNDYGRPLPKTFQSNTIVPNKSTMVEDDESGAEEDDDHDHDHDHDHDGDLDDHEEEDAFGLEGAAKRQSARRSRRTTNKSIGGSSVGSGRDKLVADLQAQVSELREKLDGLDAQLKAKEAQIEDLQATEKERDSANSNERAEWSDLQHSLERKLSEAQNLNESLRSELDKVRAESDEAERSFQMQLEDIQLQQRHAGARDGGTDDHSSQEVADLQRALREQQQLTDEVKQDLQQTIDEIRQLSQESQQAMEKEERYQETIAQLESEVKEWKARYARAKTQARHIRNSSVGLTAFAQDASHFTRDPAFTQPDGMAKAVDVTRFQMSVDELLQTARKTDGQAMMDAVKAVVGCVRDLTAGIDSVAGSPHSSTSIAESVDTAKQTQKIKSRVSATTNNLITATKIHANAAGLSPVSLLDAAASHLSNAVIDLLRVIKIRPIDPAEDGAEDGSSYHELADKPSPLARKSYLGFANGGSGSSNGGSRRHSRARSRGSVASSSGSPSRWSNARRSEGPSALLHGISASLRGSDEGGPSHDPALAAFKNYLDDQTALLVQSIQPLVQRIRGGSGSGRPADDDGDDQAAIAGYVEAIGRTVGDTVARTEGAVQRGGVGGEALRRHALPVVDVLDRCRRELMDVVASGSGGGQRQQRERIPPVAFRMARAMKELVLRVERVETGALGDGDEVGGLEF